MNARPALNGWFLLVAGTVARLGLALYHDNYDIASYRIVGDLVLTGKNVYAHTGRYNYGPIWAGVLGGLRAIQYLIGRTDLTTLHLLVTSLLTVVNWQITRLFRQRFGWLVAALFFLNPVSLLVSGFHGQFDNLALLFGLWSWHRLTDRPAGTLLSGKRLWQSAGWLGLSLMTKHVLFLWPVWVWLGAGHSPERPFLLPQRLAYGLIGCGMFVLGFLPFALDPTGLAGIREHVFGYTSGIDGILLPTVLARLDPEAYLAQTLQGIPVFGGIRFVWLLVLTGIGAVVARHPVWRDRVFYLYPIALLVSTVGMSSQYLVIPLLSMPLAYRRWPFWLFVGTATLRLLKRGTDWLGSASDWHGFPVLSLYADDGYIRPQSWLLVLLIGYLSWRLGKPESGCQRRMTQ